MMKKVLEFLGRHKVYVIPVLLAVGAFLAIVLLSDVPVEERTFNYSFF